MIFVIRNSQRFGPYSEQTLLSYVNQGQVLMQDKAVADNDTDEHTVGFYLKRARLTANVEHKGNILSQLKHMGMSTELCHAALPGTAGG